MSGPLLRINQDDYPLPESERLGELRLIERVTGLSHREWRTRMLDQQERILAAADDGISDDALLRLLDDIVMLGRIAQAVQRKHPEWTTDRVAKFVDTLDAGDIQLEPGDDPSPPAEAETTSANGTDSAPQSSSASDTASSESASLETSGTSTSPTSPAAPSESKG